MKNHKNLKDLLPFYVAGSLDAAQTQQVESHLLSCADCKDEVNLWRAISDQVVAEDENLNISDSWAERALSQAAKPSRLAKAFRQAWQLLRAQAMLIQTELWPVSALIMVMGILVAVIAQKTVIVYFMAPLVAASTLATLYGAEHDPAAELTQSTPTSAWKILFARMSIVSAYNLVLSLVASFALLFVVSAGTLGTIILNWFGPLAFLSSVALLLSIWLDTGKAIFICYSLWLLQYIPLKAMNGWLFSAAWTDILTTYKNFWMNTPLLVCLSIVVLVAALWSANKPAIKLLPSGH